MANAHIPNSEATPGWKNHKFARTDFLDAIKVTPIEGFGGSRYAGNAPVDWCSGADSRGKLPVLGGYLGAVLITAACQFSRTQFETRTEHDPLSVYVKFLQPVRQGPHHVALSILHSSASQATIKAEIVPADSAKNIVYCQAIICIGSLRRGNTSLEKRISQRRVALPDRIKDCSRWVDAFFYYVNPPSTTVRCYTPAGGPAPLWSPAYGGRNIRYVWNKLDNGQMYKLEYVPLLVDLVRTNHLPKAGVTVDTFALFHQYHDTRGLAYLNLRAAHFTLSVTNQSCLQIPPLPLNYEDNALEGIVKYQLPTISLKVDFCTNVDGKEWLLSKTHMRWLYGGRFEEN